MVPDDRRPSSIDGWTSEASVDAAGDATVDDKKGGRKRVDCGGIWELADGLQG